jgi:hypothetical protein
MRRVTICRTPRHLLLTNNRTWVFLECLRSLRRRNVAEEFDAVFRHDRTHNLITRLRHNVIRTGLRRINVAYSRISLADVATRLGEFYFHRLPLLSPPSHTPRPHTISFAYSRISLADALTPRPHTIHILGSPWLTLPPAWVGLFPPTSFTLPTPPHPPPTPPP